MKTLDNCQRCKEPVYVKIPSAAEWLKYMLYTMGMHKLAIYCNKCKAAREALNVK